MGILQVKTITLDSFKEFASFMPRKKERPLGEKYRKYNLTHENAIKRFFTDFLFGVFGCFKSSEESDVFIQTFADFPFDDLSITNIPVVVKLS